MKKLNKVQNDSLEMSQEQLIEKYNLLLVENSRISNLLYRFREGFEMVNGKLDQFHFELKDSKDFQDEYHGNEVLNQVLRDFEYLFEYNLTGEIIYQQN